MATEPQTKPLDLTPVGPSPYQRWALLLLALIAAAFLRFWQLGELPPGLYRDEAWNGLDALKVLQGEHALFFPANNGREPTYIYLAALSIWLFGRSAFSLRLAAAAISTLTTLTTFQLGKSWFGWRTGLFSAWLWATTVWPFHLGRIGFRAVLLPFYLSLIFWLGTMAYRKPNWWRWLLTGLVYGLSFYTYLAVRFTPVLLGAIAVYVIWRGRGHALRLALPWFSLGTGLALAPLLWLTLEQPEMMSGRTGQVSILNSAINQGDPWGTTFRHIIQALGLFFGQGDTILRHNPPGRPLFDLFMLPPFLLGLWFCWHTRHRLAAVVLGLWVFIMLWPTILAEDTPHFLRAVGILPAAILIPALGLSHLSSWNKLRSHWRLVLVLFLCVASTVLSLRDYFWQYARQPETAYLFEAAASDMAEDVLAENQETLIFIDQRLWEGWPSVPFLLESTRPIHRFQPEDGLPMASGDNFVVYLWPFAPHEFLHTTIPPTATVTIEVGSLARGDLDPTPLPFVVRYQVQPTPQNSPITAQFGDQVVLHEASYTIVDARRLQFDLTWGITAPLSQEIKLYVHILEGDIFVGQADMLPGQGYWSNQGWQPGLLLEDRFVVSLQEPFDAANHTIFIGLYDAETLIRLPITAEDKPIRDEGWQLH